MINTIRSVLAVSALLALAAAQERIDPNSVSNSTKQYWCEQQQTQCPYICLQETDGASDATVANTCDPYGLTYNCVCSNGASPNISEYSQTLPYFLCTEWGNQCVSNCGQNSDCAHDCRANHPCGAQNPTRINVTSTATTGTATGTATGSDSAATTNSDGDAIYTGFGGDSSGTGSSDAAASTETGAASRPSVPLAFRVAGYGQAGGIVVLVAAFFGGFAIML